MILYKKRGRDKVPDLFMYHHEMVLLLRLFLGVAILLRIAQQVSKEVFVSILEIVLM